MEVCASLYRLPTSNVITIYSMRVNFGTVWNLSIIFTIIGFALLGVWAWNFIKVRKYLRTYVTFFVIITTIATLGSLVFTSLIFTVVEKNNFELMKQGADTESLIMIDRSNNSLFIARTIATDQQLQNSVKNDNNAELSKITETYFKNSGVDILRVYNTYGEVIASPSDPRDKEKMFNTDPFITYGITEKSQVKTYDVETGVLSPSIVCRSIYPLVSDDKLIGLVETGYKFDDAFVDFSKKKTGLDVTIFSDINRSASTIMTEDGVSRWKGSNSTNSEVIDTVIKNGKNLNIKEITLEKMYYNSYVPIRDINGKIIGITAVGTPTNLLFEDTRQELINAFLISTLISLVMTMLVAKIGYFSTKKTEHKSAQNDEDNTNEPS